MFLLYAVINNKQLYIGIFHIRQLVFKKCGLLITKKINKLLILILLSSLKENLKCLLTVHLKTVRDTFKIHPFKVHPIKIHLVKFENQLPIEGKG